MRRPAPNLHAFVDDRELDALVRRARDEDLGPDGLDVTTQAFIPEDLTAVAAMVARQPGRLSGVTLLPRIAGHYDKRVSIKIERKDGHAVAAGETIATFTGSLRSILAIERVALNFCSHLSGIATLTARFTQKVEGTVAAIYDTRKTIPGLRDLAKYAVACGGGNSHRVGLYDAMLIKDNHLAHVPLAELRPTLRDVVARARVEHPALKFIEVEVDSLDQLERVLDTGVDIVLLDNMTVEQLRQAVELRQQVAPAVALEASGGVTLETIEAIARSGVDRISVGSLTHSAPALDLGLDIG
jgi:nicotinate-nucleotide pyrophosphorylase (carboxylating)